MTIFVLIISILFLVTVFVFLGIDAFIAFRKKKYLIGVISIIAIVVVLLWLLTLALSTISINSLIVSLVLAISVFFINKLQINKKEAIVGAVLVFTAMTVVCYAMGFSLLELECERHIVYEPYTIRVCDNSVEITTNFDKLPDLAYAEIVSKSVEMKENGEEYYAGRAIVIYECIDKIFSELHSECTCTSEGLCDLCKENILNTRVIVE